MMLIARLCKQMVRTGNLSAESACKCNSRPYTLAAAEIKQQMVLPCNYMPDGFYMKEQQEIFPAELCHHDGGLGGHRVPILIEAGGHDGITNSTSLMSSICLNATLCNEEFEL